MGGQEQPAGAPPTTRLAACTSPGIGRRGKQGRELPKPRGWQCIIADLPSHSPAFAFSAMLPPRTNASTDDPSTEPRRPSSRETLDEERRRTVLLVSGKGHPLNGDARRIRVGLPGLRRARSVCKPGWTPLANGCDKQSVPLRAATTDSRPDSFRCTPGAWRSNPCVEVAAPFAPRADSKGVSV